MAENNLLTVITSVGSGVSRWNCGDLTTSMIMILLSELFAVIWSLLYDYNYYRSVIITSELDVFFSYPTWFVIFR
jgi:hypothetical protein